MRTENTPDSAALQTSCLTMRSCAAAGSPNGFEFCPARPPTSAERLLIVLLQAAPLLQVVICASESIDIAGRDCAQNEVTGLPDEALADLLLQLAPQVHCLCL